MPDVGVRELKTRASELVRTLREGRARYTVTYRGRAVAVLLPVEDVASPELVSADPWKELVALGAELSTAWTADQSSAELLSEMRR